MTPNQGGRYKKKIEEASFNEAPDLKVTISIGVVSSEISSIFEDLIKKADSALYQSKNSGRNKVTAHIEFQKLNNFGRV